VLVAIPLRYLHGPSPAGKGARVSGRAGQRRETSMVFPGFAVS
jgi:hypothetical protein